MEQLIKIGLKTESQKESNDFQWYKDIIDSLDHVDEYFSDSTNDLLNYELYNGKIDSERLKNMGNSMHILEELPTKFTHKDIVSSKIKVVLGLESTKPFSWTVRAVNPEATTRKEQKKFDLIKQYVVSEIVAPIRKQVEMKYAQQLKGKELSDDEKKQIFQQIEQETKTMTPPEVEEYMKRKYQEPIEIAANRLLNYIVKEQDIKRKFNNGMKSAALVAHEIYWIGEYNGKPVIENINKLNFKFDRTNKSPFIEDGEWAGVDMWLSKSEIVSMFGDELTEDEIRGLYSTDVVAAADWDFRTDEQSEGKIRVIHRTWKALKKIGFFTFVDPESSEIVTNIVDEYFKIPDGIMYLDLKWLWIPEVYEGYKICSENDIYVKLRPVPGQRKNIDNIYDSKLPYVGGIYDSDNSEPTSIMDRMIDYQLLYDIIMYRIELLMASDKGKLLLMNIGSIPVSKDISLDKWLYYAEALKIGFLNPNEPGSTVADVTNLAKEVDMSLVSNIQHYIELASYIEEKCGQSVGISKEMEARINQYQAVKNTEQAIIQSGYILSTYFEKHDSIKKNVLTQLLNLTIELYSKNNTEVIEYVLDDLSREVLKLDKDELVLNQFGLFVENNAKTDRIKSVVENILMQKANQQAIDVSKIISILEQESLTDIKEMVSFAEKEAYDREMEKLNADNKNKMELEDKMQKFKREEWKEEEKQIVLKERERRETVLQQQAILAMGFDKDKDRNNNNIPDVLEVAKAAIDADLKERKMELEEKKFEHQKQVDNTKKEK